MQEKIKQSLATIRSKKFFTLEYITVSIILVISFVLRVFRVDQILGFYYDQGRDAQVIWDLIHSHKFFLIGPTTGLAGVFRGPFYYYLIAPFYWLGKGNPVYPAVFLAILSVAALAIMYHLAKKIGGVKTGMIAIILGAFSFEIIYASRWLSNPTPMLLLSMILVWCMFQIQDGKKYYWVLLSFILGSSFFHFGSSGELFYFPAVAVFAIWKRKTLNWKIIFYSIIAFLVTFLPLFIFNLKHGGILQNNVSGILTTGSSFGIPTWRFLNDRLALIFVYLTSTLIHSPYEKEWFHLIVLGTVFIYFLPKLIQNNRFKVIFILLASPIIGLIFFQGNYGNFYQYYLTGYYLIFLIAVSYTLSHFFETSTIGKVLVIYFLFFFLSQNWSWTKSYLVTTDSGHDIILLSNQKAAIDWVYENAGRRDFNVDVYVPPVIPFAYDYLFKWLGTNKYHKLAVEKQVPLLYTLYEVDPPNPNRLKAWLDRQKGIGKIVKQQTFGGITVEARERILYSK
ncbi:MAG TPA: glycosyltransferase family 39 protein [Patescibacteria group bacterium]|nr:glycosyltransferase family 39 protein [Patescibacteria group bacterium]